MQDKILQYSSCNHSSAAVAISQENRVEQNRAPERERERKIGQQRKENENQLSCEGSALPCSEQVVIGSARTKPFEYFVVKREKKDGQANVYLKKPCMLS